MDKHRTYIGYAWKQTKRVRFTPEEVEALKALNAASAPGANTHFMQEGLRRERIRRTKDLRKFHMRRAIFTAVQNSPYIKTRNR